MLFRSDRKSTRLNSSHTLISYAVFCLKKKKREAKPGYSKRTGRARARDETGGGVWTLGGVFVSCSVGQVLVVESVLGWFFFFNDTATTEIYTLSLHDALPI